MLNVIPITQTKIDWTAFNSRICDYVTDSPYETIRDPISDYRTFLQALTRLSDLESKVILSESIDHISFGFILHCNEFLLTRVMSRTRLRVVVAHDPKSISDIRTAVVSGTLKEFLHAIQDHLQQKSPSNEERTLYSFLMLYFENQGLGDLWRDWRKIPRKDGTFLLEYRP